MRRCGIVAPLIHLVLLVATTAQGQSVTPPWSVRFADAVVTRNPQVHTRWDYTAGVVLLAIHKVGESTGSDSLNSYVRRNIDQFIQADGTIAGYKADEFNLDQIAEGRLLFPLFAQTHDDRYRKAAATLRDQLRHQPRTTEGGFWHKKIYPQQMWLDGRKRFWRTENIR